ncbi:MAG: zinc-ribbon domain-containing protein [Deltaproteobacteria bacterium]|nr:zinc-ribbon domain-containing protein [Deltaproteobacteria bacterium]
MIITCENCHSEFNIDAKMIKAGGSKVRCANCRKVFMVYPPTPEPLDEPVIAEEPVLEEKTDGPERESAEGQFHEDLEETVALDSPPAFKESDDEKLEDLEDFDRAFEEALENDAIEDVTPQQDQAGSAEGSDTEQAEEETYSTRELFEKASEEDIDEELAEPSLPAARKKKGGVLKFFLLLFIIVLILIGGAAAIYFFAPQYIPDSLTFLKPETQQMVVDTDVRRINFRDVDGQFIDSPVVGKLFIIKGIVTNENSQSRGYILVKGVILDDKGEPIRHKLAYAGNYYSDNELAQMAMDDIDKGLRNRAGKGNINTDVKPGASIPFMIIFDNLPQNVSEFIVEAVSSSPVNK